MRIVAGVLKGRQFDSPNSNRTHPMSERMRGALFNSLGDIQSLSVLDAFGGSGALSFESISRGAKDSVIVEIDKTAFDTIHKNIKKLGVSGRIKAIRANVSSWSDNNPDSQFDVVLCNPPFDKLDTALIEKLAKHVRKSGLLVLCWPTQTQPISFQDLDMAPVKEKDYGDAQLVFYRKSQ